MANFGKRPINDAGQAESLRRPKSFFHDGEERLDRQPYGTKARFVDPVGNVITLANLNAWRSQGGRDRHARSQREARGRLG
jgi:hypothetical protein